MDKQEEIGLFLGTFRGLAVLKALINNKRKITSVLILEQKKHEFENAKDLIIKLCKKNYIPYTISTQVKSENYKDYLLETRPRIVFVISWRFLIPKECFDIPENGIFVLHDSLLPRYRGFSPTNWVIINGEKETGITLQYINERVDVGDIVDQIKINLDSQETAKTLNDKLLRLYPKIILKNIDLILKKQNQRISQNEKYATYGCKRSPDDGKLDFTKDTHILVQLIRGLTYPYPGAFCYFKNKKIIIWKAEDVKISTVYEGRIPGKIISITSEYVDTLTGNGILRIFSISDAQNDKRILNPKEILNSLSVSLN